MHAPSIGTNCRHRMKVTPGRCSQVGSEQSDLDVVLSMLQTRARTQELMHRLEAALASDDVWEPATTLPTDVARTESLVGAQQILMGLPQDETDHDNTDGEEDHGAFPIAPEGFPKAFLCPISLALMKDPVVAADGHTYDRATPPHTQRAPCRAAPAAIYGK